ncbi:MAG: NAD(P)H-dependent oxidoreductase [Gammaproteobacteria bacterium]|nr:NAD(P)H-dependent oxidoreductase [Gammaproteobacteria bacterium]
MKELIIVANQPSANTRLLADAVTRGAQHPDISNVTVSCFTPLEATVDKVQNADGIIIGTTENFGYMSGLIKDFFERIYYPCLETKQGLPYALYIKAGLDGTGTTTAVNKIISGLRWREVHDLVLLKGEYQSSFELQCEELGTHMAAGLEAGIF